MKGIVSGSMFLILSTVEGHFFNEKAKGWHWYQLAVGSDRPHTKDKSKPSEANMPKNAVSELAEKRKELDEAMAASILRPTSQNVARYQRLQSQWLNQSQTFASVWQHNLLQHPELDATVKHPVTQYGIQLKKEDDQRRLKHQIKGLSTQYGLFFIYQGQCKFCQGMAGVVKLLSETYGWKVLGISQDGVILPEFPDSKRDNGLSQAWGIRGVPAVFAVNPTSEEVIPIGHGLISLDQLERNLILQLIQKGRP